MDGIRELLAQLKLFCRLDVAFCDKLEEHDKEIYALKEDNKRMLATCRSLEKRYAELMYAFAAIKKDGI